jgi:hypothetical protein
VAGDFVRKWPQPPFLTRLLFVLESLPGNHSMSTDQHRCVRWGTPFGRFVRMYGVALLAQQLQVEPAAIYQWIRGHTSPRPPTARAIVKLADVYVTLEQASGNAPAMNASIELNDIYAQRDIHAD